MLICLNEMFKYIYLYCIMQNYIKLSISIYINIININLINKAVR
jgi:hypothetical protein